MGEQHELKNRYMLINLPEEWKNEASTEQVPNKFNNKTGQVQDKCNAIKKAVGSKESTV